MIRIIDCSFTAALFLPDENSEKIAAFFSDSPKSDVLHVPLLWWYEISNVLAVSEKRNRLKHSDILNIISLIDELEIITDTQFGPRYIKDLYTISRQYGISAYDAAYLELALRKGGALASLDDKLCKAGEKAGLNISEF